ncbi:hypothetical protein KA107_02530 [Candidatus Pacearchaeota archaeon]|nr:hypothetical protein [Candidatus Pacearchaeota archaeon]
MPEQTEQQREMIDAMCYRQIESRRKERTEEDRRKPRKDYSWIKQIEELRQEGHGLVAVLKNPDRFLAEKVSINGKRLRGKIKVQVMQREVRVAPLHIPQICWGEDPTERISKGYCEDREKYGELFFNVGQTQEPHTAYQVYVELK